MCATHTDDRRGAVDGFPRFAGGCEERFDDFRIELCAGSLADDFHRDRDLHRFLVGTLAGQRIKNIGHGHDPAGERDGFPGQAGGIAAAIPPLVVGGDDFLHQSKQWLRTQ